VSVDIRGFVNAVLEQAMANASAAQGATRPVAPSSPGGTDRLPLRGARV
jgi:hypothetical protein